MRTTDYLHRAGRTGRMGKKGTVVSFYSIKDEKIIEKLNKAFEKNEPVQVRGTSFKSPMKNKEITPA